MSPSIVRATCAAIVLNACAVCRAETAPSEAIVAGLNLQRMPNADGGSVGVDWVRASERRLVTAGVDLSNVGASQWTLFRGTAAQNRGTRTAFSGSLAIGPGSNDGESFTFLKAGLGLSTPLPGRWRLVAEDLYVDVEPVAGHLVILAGETALANALSLRLQTSRSASGTLDEQNHLVRFDYRAKVPYLMGGFAAGTTNNALTLGGPATESRVTELREAFFGMSFPIRGKELTVALQLGEVGTARRNGVSFVVKSPIEQAE